MAVEYTLEKLEEIGTIAEEKRNGYTHIVKFKEPVKYFENVLIFNENGYLCGEKFVEISKKRYETIIQNIIGYSLEEVKEMGEIEIYERDNMLIIKLCGLERYFERRLKYDEKGEICEEKFFEIFKSRYEDIKVQILSFSLIELKAMGTIQIVIEECEHERFYRRIIKLKETERYFENKWTIDGHGEPCDEWFIEISKEKCELIKQKWRNSDK